MVGISLLSRISGPFAVVILASVLVLMTSGVSEGSVTERRPNPRSCGEAAMCCQGQNNTCFVFGQRVDRSDDSSRCYCDSNCLIMGDCCMDYHHTCKSVDCQVGDWEEWTTCDNPCGYGTRKRTRDVTQYPDNGGSHCPVLKQRRACVGFEAEVCSQNLIGEQAEEKAEQARILPIEFGIYRTEKKYDPWKGILKNLYAKYFNEIFTRATYRGKYQITSTHHGCENSEWASILKANTSVCVECQPVAMNREIGMRCLGHGVYNAETAWKAVDVPHCHGTWIMTDGHQPETCNINVEDDNKRNFIFL
ncbi:unnamed protein product [Lymnaea stagnalis]|uniref:SMB domain-containing protein n=1 Tax=Lymnaea stagnalis TaxID=6523 RepID=A0AAV2HTL8_LYMST